MNIQEYKKQRSKKLDKELREEIRKLPDMDVLGAKDFIKDFNDKSVDGVVELIEKEVDRLEKKTMITDEQYRRMDLLGMCQVRCDMSFNLALKELICFLKVNK